MLRPVVLASSSPYRRQLLGRLRVPFTCCAPNIDESTLAGETPAAKAERLAKAKVASVKGPEHALVIGSDQTMESGAEICGKPGSIDGLRRMLRTLSGSPFVLHTAVCISAAGEGRISKTFSYGGTVLPLSAGQIERYLALEPATDCAGGIKVEGLGVCLLGSLSGEDPTGVIGLPLTFVARSLEKLGVPVPG